MRIRDKVDVIEIPVGLGLMELTSMGTKKKSEYEKIKVPNIQNPCSIKRDYYKLLTL